MKAARNQLFAEAVALVKTKGEPLFMETAELTTAAAEVAAARHAVHPWVERVASWLAAQTAKPPTFLTARDVFIDAMGSVDSKLDRRAETAIASCMKAIGWMPTVKWDGSARCAATSPRAQRGTGSSTPIHWAAAPRASPSRAK